MRAHAATALAHPNIALIKYWGNRDHALRIPANGSISVNLDGLYTRTQVEFNPVLERDSLILDGEEIAGAALERVSKVLERVRGMAGLDLFAEVESANNFPAGTGIASSASAFSALALAASSAAGLQLSEKELSRLARLGSGSACRSVPPGFVEWQAGESDETSFAYSIARPEHWDLVDCVAMVSRAPKPTGSTAGHSLADTSPLQAARVAGAPRRLETCRRAVLERDFAALAEIVELDSNLMHAVMITSTPRLLYWQPATLAVMQAVQSWREAGAPVCYTVDAGPNVHVLCTAEVAGQVAAWLGRVPGITEVFTAHPGAGARLVASP